MVQSAGDVEEITIPGSVADPAFGAYAAFQEVRFRNERSILGAAATSADPSESLPYFQDHAETRKRLFVARIDGEIVGQALLEYDRSADSPVAWIFGGVLEPARRQGVGTRLFGAVEEEARSAGCGIAQSFVLHGPSGGEARIIPRTGIGSLPADDPGARFVTRRGYELEQVTQWNVLDLPVDDATLASLLDEAAGRAGSTYRVHSWAGPSPESWLDDLALLAAALEQDVPHGELKIGSTTWDADRVRRQEAREEAGGRRLLTTVVEHVPTGRLAGYTRLSLPGDPAGPAAQTVTLVLDAHRGHRLGMLLKATNLARLRDVAPDAPLVLTANAAENAHMLEINRRLGFRTAAYTGAWKKALA